MTLERLVLVFGREGEILLRCLYRTQDGPGPSTKARKREVSRLTLEALTQALTALDKGDVEVVGTSGFTTREDVLNLSTASSDTQQPVRKGART